MSLWSSVPVVQELKRKWEETKEIRNNIGYNKCINHIR